MEKNKFLYAEERKQEILKLLDETGRIQVADLIDIFQVSGSTIRTDIRELEYSRLLVRTHGGAIRNHNKSLEDVPNVREVTEEKRKIAEHAVSLLKDEDSIAIDTGTTCQTFATALANSDLKDLHILTHDLQIAILLSERTDFNVTILGGTIRNHFQYAAGESVIREMAKYSVDKAIVATTSFSIERGYSTPNVGTAELKRAMLDIARQKIILFESSKIGKESFCIFGETTKADVIVTDKSIKKKDLQKLEALKINVQTI